MCNLSRYVMQVALRYKRIAAGEIYSITLDVMDRNDRVCVAPVGHRCPSSHDRKWGVVITPWCTVIGNLRRLDRVSTQTLGFFIRDATLFFLSANGKTNCRLEISYSYSLNFLILIMRLWHFVPSAVSAANVTGNLNTTSGRTIQFSNEMQRDSAMTSRPVENSRRDLYSVNLRKYE